MSSMKDTTLRLLNDFTILVVEDDFAARLMIKQNLQKHCKRFIEASDGLQGYEAFKKEKIDMIVTDIQMPLYNGFEMIEKILKINPSQPFIVMSSFDTDQNVLNSIKEGALSFLRKPLNIADLQTSLLIALSKIDRNITQINEAISVDVKNEVIFENGKAIFLSHQNHKLFWLLYYNKNRLVSYEMLEDYVFDNEIVNKNAQYASVMRLKKQLNGVEIENISGSGYTLRI